MAILGGQMHRRPVQIVGNRRRSAHPIKVLHQRFVTLGGGNVQRCHAVAVLRVHIRAVVDEDAHHVDVATSGGQMQGRVAIDRRCLRDGRLG